MSINFTQILTDSLNFMRNQRTIVMRFTAYFFIVALLIHFLISHLLPEDVQLNELNNGINTLDMSSTHFGNVAYLGIVQVILNLFISAWGIFTIHQLSQRIKLSLIDTFLFTLKRFLGFFFISLIITIPILIGSAEMIVSYLTQKPSSPFSLLTTAFGLFIFVRLNIASIYYLTNQTTLNETIKNVWKLGVKQNFPLFIYFLINDVLLRLLSYQVNRLISGSSIVEIISLFIISLIGVFSLVFTYRFYSVFTHRI
ncbi:hypothetical protein EV697_101399 [Bisgaardia hudsonensis]|uniref:Uncharacterized protein n=1 Tax=Bisgaardia hudsonensis TaxID=109472 RepID=A0A4V2SJD1_9PAST|nr:hypothetical protein [Bisgaardia hudsonensis]QLB13896.1 hypothetical protein A6A11_03370 [Bisgaardia hudsonensis]TCP14260.1 hypothetical protein EV697_101399 [Bisgaardia hudsonensis]